MVSVNGVRVRSGSVGVRGSNAASVLYVRSVSTGGRNRAWGWRPMPTVGSVPGVGRAPGPETSPRVPRRCRRLPAGRVGAGRRVGGTEFGGREPMLVDGDER